MILSYHFKLPLALCFVLLILASPLFAAEISVSVDRNPVNLKESFQITFTANDDADGEPDFSPLDKDFEILNQSQQQSVQIINWKKTKSLQWILTVMAKHTGNLVIPAINFGQDSSQFSSILVNDAQVASSANKDLFLQVEVNTPRPYVQEQVIYTLKLFRKVNISQAALSEPVLKDAVIEKLGEDKNYNTQFQGESYIVTERKYAIFPQKSGMMSIAPLTLTANVIIPGQRRSNSFFNRQRTQAKRVVSAAINLEVLAKPADASSIWLPAKRVLLQEIWTDNATQIIVGQPITRTIRLTVEGETASALPELFKNNMPPNLKAYPDQPVLKENAGEDGMVAYREEKIALIPGQAGSYILPAIEISWWNTQTREMQIARIAERTITAIVAPDTVDKPADQGPPLIPGPTLSTQIDTEPASFWKNSNLWFGLAVFFACGWLGTVVYFLSKKGRKVKNESTGFPAEKQLAIDKQLKKACTNNDSVMAKDALLRWGRDKFNQSSLTKVAEQCNRPLQAELVALNAVLYGDKTAEWQGAKLWTAFQNNKAAGDGKSSDLDPLQPLFNI
ncbi:MAG: protein BatD [Gammaproteobacteria bacterium]|nr:MAG: protein BatD [Gammaproteobacteria bacterium]